MKSLHLTARVQKCHGARLVTGRELLLQWPSGSLGSPHSPCLVLGTEVGVEGDSHNGVPGTLGWGLVPCCQPSYRNGPLEELPAALPACIGGSSYKRDSRARLSPRGRPCGGPACACLCVSAGGHHVRVLSVPVHLHVTEGVRAHVCGWCLSVNVCVYDYVGDLSACCGEGLLLCTSVHLSVCLCVHLNFISTFLTKKNIKALFH
jgi:hypothetical protein